MNSWLLTILTVPFLLAASSRADEAPAGGFEKHKAQILSEIDQHLQKAQEHKACVTAATTPDALKACRATMKEWHHNERLEHMGKKKERLEERMNNLKQKESK